MSFVGRAADSTSCKINITTSFFTADGLNQIYYVNADNEIVKFNCNDSTSITYSNYSLGTPTSIDVSNPLKILVFYKDQQTIVILDNELSAISTIQLKGNFNGINYQPAAICKLEGTDHIWMYDELSRKLIRLDESGQLLAASESFDQQFDFNLDVVKIFSSQDKVYVNVKNEGFLVFDAYANYVTTIPFLYIAEQVTDKYIIALNGITAIWYSLQSGKAISVEIVGTPISQLFVVGNKIYYKTDDGIFLKN